MQQQIITKMPIIKPYIHTFTIIEFHIVNRQFINFLYIITAIYKFKINLKIEMYSS